MFSKVKKLVYNLLILFDHKRWLVSKFNLRVGSRLSPNRDHKLVPSWIVLGIYFFEKKGMANIF